MSADPPTHLLQTVLFWMFYVANLLLLVIISLNSARLKTISPYGKKMVFLALFCIYFVAGKTVFKNIHSLVTTALPTLTMYLIDWILGKVVIIGLTGGIACGKSTLVKQFKDKYKIKVIDCDEISKTLKLPGRKSHQFIVQQFGQQFVDPTTKMIKNDKLGELVFKDQNARNILTIGTGKFILIEVATQAIKHITSGNKLILIDAPILFQTKVLEYFCCPIIVVWVDQQVQVKRLASRNGFSRDQALRRIQSQMPIDQKIKKANITVRNQDTPEAMWKKVDQQMQRFIK